MQKPKYSTILCVDYDLKIFPNYEHICEQACAFTHKHMKTQTNNLPECQMLHWKMRLVTASQERNHF